jgi:SPP1 family predicted phage head-tail adaptor
MNWRDVASLISLVETQDDFGGIVIDGTPRSVFVNQKSIRQSEFYQAMAQGLKPEIMFEIRAIDYAGEEKLSYSNKAYKIVRTFSKDGEILELVCISWG